MSANVGVFTDGLVEYIDAWSEINVTALVQLIASLTLLLFAKSREQNKQARCMRGHPASHLVPCAHADATFLRWYRIASVNLSWRRRWRKTILKKWSMFQHRWSIFVVENRLLTFASTDHRWPWWVAHNLKSALHSLKKLLENVQVLLFLFHFWTVLKYDKDLTEMCTFWLNIRFTFCSVNSKRLEQEFVELTVRT